MARFVGVVAWLLLVSACHDPRLVDGSPHFEIDAGLAPSDASAARAEQHDDHVTPQAGSPAPALHDSDPDVAHDAKPQSDAGAHDAGHDVVDAGPAAIVDAGHDPAPAVDAGTDPVHVHDAATDSTPIVDAGHDPTLIVDASMEPVHDAGSAPTPIVDAGTEPMHDAGSDPTPIVDAAGNPTPTVDAGNEPAPDAGFDAGTQPALDAEVIDAAPPVIDAEVIDAAPPVIDAAIPDAATLDAEVPDATPPAADAQVPDAAAPSCSGPPGMYKDDKCQVLADGLEAYHPQYPLWSDGAKKDRYISLPAGTQIDTSNPDRWSFPIGTRFYKTFASGDLKVETRVLEKVASATGFTSWTTVSYAWSADQRSVSPADTNGVPNALGTGFDIPSTAQCKSCHNMVGADAPIGFNALQLNHSSDGVTLTDLLARNLLHNFDNGVPNVSVANAVIPGDDATRAALGYLHGNCGHCHGGPSPRAGQRLWSVVGMTQLSDAPIMTSAVCQCLEGWTGRTNADGDPYTLRVAPSHAAISGIIGRMSSRVSGEQMPPLGTKIVDAAGLATIKAFITELDGTSCDASPPVCSP